MCYAIDPLCRFPLMDCRERVWLLIIELKLCVMRLQVFTVTGLVTCGRGMWRCSEGQSRTRKDKWLFRVASILTCACSKYGWIPSKLKMLQASCNCIFASKSHPSKIARKFLFLGTRIPHKNPQNFFVYLQFCWFIFLYHILYIWSFGQLFQS